MILFIINSNDQMRYKKYGHLSTGFNNKTEEKHTILGVNRYVWMYGWMTAMLRCIEMQQRGYMLFGTLKTIRQSFDSHFSTWRQKNVTQVVIIA